MHLISSNLLPIPIGSGQDGSTTKPLAEFGLRYCPSMDLIAVFPRSLSYKDDDGPTNTGEGYTDNYYAAEDDDENTLNVEVYRLNGQKVFTTSIEVESAKTGIVDVAWRQDGIALAIATSDNRVRLVDTFSGKLVHTFDISADRSSEEVMQISGSGGYSSPPGGKRKSMIQDSGSRKRRCLPQSLHYSTHFSNPDITSSRLAIAHEKNGRVLDDLVSLHADVDELLSLEADLPKALASIDVEQYLPKLATLPASGFGEDAVFSTRGSIDSLFHASKQSTRPGSTDIITVARDDASVHLRIFDSFEVGKIDLNDALNLPAGCTLNDIQNIVTHPLSEKVYAIVGETMNHSPSKGTRKAKTESYGACRLNLLSLDLRFLQQSSIGLPVLATKATQLHHLIRYLQQIEKQLAKEIKTAFDLPSRFIRTLEEDLKEQDGEGSTFETSAYHALLTGEVSGKFKEWLNDILGDRGVKRWEKAVSECLDNVRRLMNENWNPAVERAGVVVSRLTGLAASGTFNMDKATLEGLRDTIDVMAVIGEDLLRDVGLEILGFSAFITWLKREVEAAGLEDTSEKLEEMRESSDHCEVRKVLKYVSTRVQDTAVKKYIRDGQDPNGMKTDDLAFYKDFCEGRRKHGGQTSPPSMKLLTSRLRVQCDRLFGQVAQQLREKVLVEHIGVLPGFWDTETLECRIVYEQEYPVLKIFAADLEKRGTLKTAQRPLDIAKSNIKTAMIMLDDSEEVLDVKCADDQTVFVLARTISGSQILGVEIGGEVEHHISTLHVFGGAKDNFTKLGLVPWKMDVNARKGRRALTVLDRQGRGYGVFDLDGVTTDEDAVMSN